MTEKLPFAFTKPIVRYLETILKYYNDNKPGQADEGVLPRTFIFETYLSDEKFYNNYEEIRWEFVNYLEKNGAGTFIRIQENTNSLPSRWVANVNMPDEELPIEERFEFNVTNISTIKDLYQLYLKAKKLDGIENDYDVMCKIYYEDEDVFRIFGNTTPYLITSKNRIYVFKKLWEARKHTYNGHNVENGEGVELKSIARDLPDILTEKELKKFIRNFDEYLGKKFDDKIKLETKADNVTLTITEKDLKK